MTDFSTELLPDEEEKAEIILPGQEDSKTARKATVIPATTEDKSGLVLASAGNSVLAQQFNGPIPQNAASNTSTNVAVKNIQSPESGNQKRSASTPATATTLNEKNPQPDPALQQEAGQLKTDPAAELQLRLKLLTETLTWLLKTPENAPVETLFTAYRGAPVDLQADAALAIANTVLRIEADTRRRARVVLAHAIKLHRSLPLAQILVIRFGAWVSAQPIEPIPPAPADPGDDA